MRLIFPPSSSKEGSPPHSSSLPLSLSLHVQLFANVLSQWKIQRPFKEQSGVERWVDQKEAIFIQHVFTDRAPGCASWLMRHLHVHIFPLERHMILKCTIGISSTVICLFKKVFGEITDNLSVAL